ASPSVARPTHSRSPPRAECACAAVPRTRSSSARASSRSVGRRFHLLPSRSESGFPSCEGRWHHIPWLVFSLRLKSAFSNVERKLPPHWGDQPLHPIYGPHAD